jgi:hypothetical protein
MESIARLSRVAVQRETACVLTSVVYGVRRRRGAAAVALAVKKKPAPLQLEVLALQTLLPVFVASKLISYHT